MKPILTITDTVRVRKDLTLREKTVALFGHVVYRLSECAPTGCEEKTIGFNSFGTNLTYVEDE